MKRLRIIFFLFLLIACKQSSEEMIIEPPELNRDLDDAEYIWDRSYDRGDIRRYGIYPDSVGTMDKFTRVLELARAGMPLYFPQGYYPMNINLEGAENIEITFDNANIGGGLSIVESGQAKSSHIALKGNLTVLDRVFIRHSSHIAFDSLSIVSDTLLNLYGKNNRGLSIYAGAGNISIQKLKVENTGGDHTDHFKYTAAAVQIHGWNNNPENVSIEELIIENAERTGAYITGSNIKIKDVLIEGFGSGSSMNMAGLDDAPPGSEKSFTGLWINKCNNCEIVSLAIYNEKVPASDLRLGFGEAYKPTIIHQLKWNNNAPLNVEEDLLTNVIIKSARGDE